MLHAIDSVESPHNTIYTIAHYEDLSRKLQGPKCNLSTTAKIIRAQQKDTSCCTAAPE